MDWQLTKDFSELRNSLNTIKSKKNLEKLSAKILILEKKTQDPLLWENTQNAQKITQELSNYQQEIKEIKDIETQIQDLEMFAKLTTQENNIKDLQTVSDELAKIKEILEKLEIETLLSNEFDRNNAIINIRSGSGGQEAADWAKMLLRMYTNYFKQKNWKYEILDISYYDDNSGIKSVIVKVLAPFAYGKLKRESGTHRLVRISPFDHQNRRHTSFAAVEVIPELETKTLLTSQIQIPDKDIRVDVYRASGPGGQSVNTTDSAVRITHLPTGIVVAIQNQKSQLQNKNLAMEILQSKLFMLEQEKKEQKLQELGKGSAKATWGDQIRNYVLNPFQLVKDVRTLLEIKNSTSVLDGNIEPFINAQIQQL